VVTLDQLRYFITASEEGGFAAAGKKLFVTTQTISGAIHALEGYVGGKLFEKRAGHMVPTQEGAMLMTQAKYVLRECEAFDAHAKALFINKSNHPLRIVIADYYPSGVALDADIAHALLSEFTCTNLEMWNCRATACLDALRMGRADASILLGCPEETDMESESILKMHPHIAFSENNATGDSILDGISSGKTSVATPLDPAHFANKYADQIGIPSRLISFETVRPATNELRRFFSQGGVYVCAAKCANYELNR